MDSFYFTDSLIFDYYDKTYYLIENDKKIKISATNWESFVAKYGWESLDYNLETKLDSKYRILECGAGGDCFFHSLSEALNLSNIYQNIDTLYDTQTVRNYAASMITDNNFDFILNNYIIEAENDEFQGDWNPKGISSIDSLKNEITKCGDNFWADNIILSLLSQFFKINFVIITIDQDDNYSIIQLSKTYKQNIIFLYELGCHYKLIGRFDGKKIKTVFSKLPKNISNFII